jgi:hypothetical protein
MLLLCVLVFKHDLSMFSLIVSWDCSIVHMVKVIS